MFEIRDLSENLCTKRELICEYGQVVLTDKGLIFIDYYTNGKARVKPEELETMKIVRGVIKFEPFTMSKMRKKIKIPAKRNIERKFYSFTVPKDNAYTLDGNPMPKGVVVLLCNPPRLYTDKRTLITETKIVEKPNFSLGLTSNKVGSGNHSSQSQTAPSRSNNSAVPSQKVMSMKNVIEGADWKCINVIMEQKTNGVKKWGYTLQHLQDGDMQQVNITTVMSLAKKGEICNLKLVESKNGEPFLQGTNGLKLEDLQPVIKK